MPLHYKTKEAAAKKHGHLVDKPDELERSLAEDKSNYNDEEIKELLQAILHPASVDPKTDKKEPAAGSFNAKILDKLKDFDYENMRGEDFKKYCLMVQSLQLDQNYDFEQYSVEVIKKDRYRGVQGSPVDIIGFKLKNSRPLNTTRIPVKYALQTNGTVVVFDDGYEVINDQFSHNGRYFLLKK